MAIDRSQDDAIRARARADAAGGKKTQLEWGEQSWDSDENKRRAHVYNEAHADKLREIEERKK